MFPCIGGERFWPLTASAGFFHAPPDAVATSLIPLGRRSPWVRSDHDSLEEALNAHAPVRSLLLIMPSGNGSWATVLEAHAPFASDMVFRLSGRALYDLGCEYIGVCWEPATPHVDAVAEFIHQKPSSTVRQPSRWWSRRSKRSLPRNDRRCVQVTDLDGHWGFSTSGAPRAFEQPEFYQRRRIADRLPRHLLARYVAAVGVPVDDSGWWDGPVIVGARNRKPRPHETPVDPSDGWSTIDELRRVCGYQPTGIPDDLAVSSRSRRPPRTDAADPRERLFARIGDINDLSRPRPLVTIQEFFEGNDDPNSIQNAPAEDPQEFYGLLRQIAARDEVADIRIEVKDLEDPDGWPTTDTIWIFTSADPDMVRAWFPPRLAPDEVLVHDRFDDGLEPYEIPPATRAIGAWYD